MKLKDNNNIKGGVIDLNNFQTMQQNLFILQFCSKILNKYFKDTYSSKQFNIIQHKSINNEVYKYLDIYEVSNIL